MAGTKAKIEHRERVVYVSGSPDDQGGQLVVPVTRRIRSSADPDRTEVHSYLSKQREPGELREALECVTDFVMLVDDGLVIGLQDADLDAIDPDPGSGAELLVVLDANDARRGADGVERPARIWLARASEIETLVGLKRVAGRADWNLHDGRLSAALHWLYEAGERVVVDFDGFQVSKRLVADDDLRLGKRVGAFLRHVPGACPHCGPAAEP